MISTSPFKRKVTSRKTTIVSKMSSNKSKNYSQHFRINEIDYCLIEENKSYKKIFKTFEIDVVYD